MLYERRYDGILKQDIIYDTVWQQKMTGLGATMPQISVFFYCFSFLLWYCLFLSGIINSLCLILRNIAHPHALRLCMYHSQACCTS